MRASLDLSQDLQAFAKLLWDMLDFAVHAVHIVSHLCFHSPQLLSQARVDFDQLCVDRGCTSVLL